MKRSTFVIFGLAVLLFAVLIPAWAISREGGEDASPESVPSSLDEGKELFVTNCGAVTPWRRPGPMASSGRTSTTCSPSEPDAARPGHDQAAGAGRDQRRRRGTDAGGILSGEQAETVADFVSQVAGR